MIKKLLDRLFGSKDSFDEAFQEVAEELNIPAEYRTSLCRAIKEHIDSPRDAAKAAEVWLSKFNFQWPEGMASLQNCSGKKGTFKQLCELVAHYVISKYRVAEQWQRIEKTKGGLPYVLLTFGPVMCRCPIHGDDYGLLLPVDHAYWKKYPPCEHIDCHCRIRQVSHWEYERLLKNGIPAPASKETQELDPKTGLPTGHRTGVRVPFKTRPSRS